MSGDILPNAKTTIQWLCALSSATFVYVFLALLAYHTLDVSESETFSSYASDFGFNLYGSVAAIAIGVWIAPPEHSKMATNIFSLLLLATVPFTLDDPPSLHDLDCLVGLLIAIGLMHWWIYRMETEKKKARHRSPKPVTGVAKYLNWKAATWLVICILLIASLIMKMAGM